MDIIHQHHSVKLLKKHSYLSPPIQKKKKKFHQSHFLFTTKFPQCKRCNRQLPTSQHISDHALVQSLMQHSVQQQAARSIPTFRVNFTVSYKYRGTGKEIQRLKMMKRDAMKTREKSHLNEMYMDAQIESRNTDKRCRGNE